MLAFIVQSEGRAANVVGGWFDGDRSQLREFAAES